MPQKVMKDKFTRTRLHYLTISEVFACVHVLSTHYCLVSATLPAGVPKVAIPAYYNHKFTKEVELAGGSCTTAHSEVCNDLQVFGLVVASPCIINCT